VSLSKDLEILRASEKHGIIVGGLKSHHSKGKTINILKSVRRP